MSFPTLTEVYTQTRAECGDTEVAGGQIYTDPMLLPHIQGATRALWRGLSNLAVPRVRRTLYYTLPINTSVFYPATAGVTDFMEPSGPIYARKGVTQVAIQTAAMSSGSLLVTTTGAHGLTTGETVVLEQIVGLNGASIQATVTVTSSTQFLANGVVTTGTYVSGGYVVSSDNEFDSLTWADNLPSASNNAANGLSSVMYQGGYFQFIPSSELHQIRIFYWSSAQVPVSGSDIISVNDCIDFLAYYAASTAQKAQGANDRAATAMEIAVGPEFTRGVIGGQLRQLLLSAVRQIQNLSPYERSPQPFRQQNYGLGYPL